MATIRPISAAAIICGVCALIALAYAWYFLPFLSDDALISMRYAERFVEGQGLTWNDGETVEGYTNLLWVLALALMHAIGVDTILATRILGVLCTLSLFCTLLWYIQKSSASSQRPTDRPTDQFVVLYAGLLLALSPWVAAWTVGGLENIMLAALLAIALANLLVFLATPNDDKPLYRAALVFGLFVLTRADAPIVVAGTALALLLSLPGSLWDKLRASAILSLIPFLFFLGQLAFRWFYYHDVLPNTYYAKFAVTESRFQGGALYVTSLLWQFWPVVLALLLATCVALLRRVREQSPASEPQKTNISLMSRRVLLAVIVAAVFLFYVLVSGGDIFPAYRHGLLVVVILAFCVAELSRYTFAHTVGATTLLAHGLLLVGMGGFAVLSFSEPENQRAKAETWEWDCKRVALQMKEMWSDLNPTIAVTAAGCMPYFTGFAAIDMFGLNDKYLAKQRPELFGNGLMGHELLDPVYVAGRRPEIVTFHTATNAEEIYPPFWDIPEFANDYRLYSFSVPDSNLVGNVWLRGDFYDRVTSSQGPRP